MNRLVFITVLFLSLGINSTRSIYAQNSETSRKIACKECGLENREASLFCAGCGSKLVHPRSPNSLRKMLNIGKNEFSPASESENVEGNTLDVNALSSNEVLSKMSRQDLILLIELLTDKPYNQPQKSNR